MPYTETSTRFPISNGMVFDALRHEVVTPFQHIHLTQREVQMLAHLVRCEKGVCTREELLADVWGLAHDPGTNLVQVTIGRLRRKLGANSVVTVRGVGYYWRRRVPAH